MGSPSEGSAPRGAKTSQGPIQISILKPFFARDARKMSTFIAATSKQQRAGYSTLASSSETRSAARLSRQYIYGINPSRVNRAGHGAGALSESLAEKSFRHDDLPFFWGYSSVGRASRSQ